ncbi:hypothetical protein DSO57_1030998 [Entomophthora muscae]|uniref:Uncharacterized protein n=1 Tax=Entomophthora muscae TaxID=34485 RepID=A0ACC2TZU6_9FUNG|nr:hypothetical protein DSO57_1030998 [Entomophthora muscae]
MSYLIKLAPIFWWALPTQSATRQFPSASKPASWGWFPENPFLIFNGLIDSALPAAGPWAVAGKALSYLVNLGIIIWWAMPVPATTPPSPAGAPQ